MDNIVNMIENVSIILIFERDMSRFLSSKMLNKTKFIMIYEEVYDLFARTYLDYLHQWNSSLKMRVFYDEGER